MAGTLFPTVRLPAVLAQDQESELFLVAQKAFDDGFYDVALRYIDQHLAAYPNSEKKIQAKLLMGQCYFFKNQYLKAYEIFQGLLDYSEFRDATLFWLGETYFKGSDFNAAKENYLKLIKDYPDSEYLPQAYYSMAWALFQQAEYDNAQDYFAKLIRLYPASPFVEDALFKIGECVYNKRDYQTASQIFNKYILDYPGSNRQAQSFFYIAEASYFIEDYLTAITYYAKAADSGYDDHLVLLAKVSMGWCYLKLDKFDLSEKYFTEAESFAAQKGILTDDVYFGEASLYSKQSNLNKALSAYASLIEKFPDSPRVPEARLGEANILYALKQYSKAVDAYQALIDQLDPNDAEQQKILEKAYYGLAWTHLKTGDIDDSIKVFENIMNKTQSTVVKVSALTQIGDAYHDAGQFDKALEIYDRILSDYPDSLYADYVQFRQGIALLKSNSIEAATMSFQSLQTNFPKSQYLNDVKYYLGVAYFKKGDWLQAVRFSREYLELPAVNKSFFSEASYILALSHFHLKEYQTALGQFKSIQKNFSDKNNLQIIASLNIAKCLYYLQRIPESLREFETIISRYPESESAQEAMVWLGDHYLSKKEFDPAIVSYSNFLQKFPGSDKTAYVHYQLGQAYQSIEKLNDAVDQYAAINPDGENKEIFAKSRLAIGEIFSTELDYNKAIETYRNIAEKAPEFKRDAYVKIAAVQRKNQQYDPALATYLEALNSKRMSSSVSDAELQFYIGDTHELLNKNQDAVDSYLKIPYLYEHATNWTIKAYLRVARIFENDEKWEDARLIYQKILNYKSEEAKYANERIEWLDKNVLDK